MAQEGGKLIYTASKPTSARLYIVYYGTGPPIDHGSSEPSEVSETLPRSPLPQP